MSTYEIIDFVADSYNPLLLILFLVYIFRTFYRGKKQKALLNLLTLSCGLLFVYGMGWIDAHWHIYDSIALDYSTHTAFAVCVILLFNSYNVVARYKLLLNLTFFFYLALMYYQGYHTAFDMIVTLGNVAPPIILLIIFVQRNCLSNQTHN